MQVTIYRIIFNIMLGIRTYLQVMKSGLIIMLLSAACASVAQHSGDVVQIEFTSATRGYQESILITSDSIHFTKVQAGEPGIDKTRAIKKEEWSDLVAALQKVSLPEVPELKSPTMKRTYDGARNSTITITTKSNQVYAHSFDDENPHQNLMPLMKCIKRLREKM